MKNYFVICALTSAVLAGLEPQEELRYPSLDDMPVIDNYYEQAPQGIPINPTQDFSSAPQGDPLPDPYQYYDPGYQSAPQGSAIDPDLPPADYHRNDPTLDQSRPFSPPDNSGAH